SPKLMVAVALKNTTFLYDQNLERSTSIYYPKAMKEVALSVSLRF
ncbi:MAG: hypothetical protein HQK50_08260, partial [Oligoflexia bacterium]|nr:hypothetical protein [Oligoflexia bacterium]